MRVTHVTIYNGGPLLSGGSGTFVFVAGQDSLTCGTFAAGSQPHTGTTYRCSFVYLGQHFELRMRCTVSGGQSTFECHPEDCEEKVIVELRELAKREEGAIADA